jgi:hypothetical protein
LLTESNPGFWLFQFGLRAVHKIAQLLAQFFQIWNFYSIGHQYDYLL